MIDIKKKNQLFLLIALLLIFIMAARTAIDTDLWWHLRAGEETLDTHSPMQYDTLSFTRYSSYWNNHSWLAQVLLYACFSSGGYWLVSLFVAVVSVVSMFLVSLQMKGNGLLKACLLVMGGIIASVNWTPRPQILSLMLLSATGLILYRDRLQPGKTRWLLPLLFAVWGNLHGGYALGILLLGSQIAGEILEKILHKNRTIEWKKIGELLLITCLSFISTAINPNGFNTWLIPFQTIGVEGLQSLISEWASPDFHQPLQMLFLVYFFAINCCLVMNKEPVHFTELVIFSVFGGMAFIARRNIGPFVLVSLPIFARHIEPILTNVSLSWNTWQRKRHGTPKQVRELSPVIQRAINGLLIFVLVAAGGIKLIAVNQLEFVNKNIEALYPEQAVRWIEEARPGGEILNEYNWGGYLVWRLRDYAVFIDGRTDLYGDEILNEWLAVVNCAPDWEDVVDRWNIQMMILSPSRAVIECSLHDGWDLSYQDKIAVVLVKGDAVQSP